MLFKISEELLAEQIFTNDEEVILRGLENILKSVWESKHLVHAQLNIIKNLRAKVQNRDCLNVLVFIENNYTFLNYSEIKHFINVIPGRNNLTLRTINYYNIIDF